jgi:phage terminase small subunit
MAKKKAAKKKTTKRKPAAQKKLSAMQERFVAEYIIEKNTTTKPSATAAAIRAGYSEKTAHAKANLLMKNAAIKRLIENAVTKEADDAGITPPMILNGLRPLLDSNLADYVIDSEGKLDVREGVPKSALLAVSSLKMREVFDFDGNIKERYSAITLWSKPQSQANAMRYRGMFKDKVELDHKGSVTIYIPDNEREGS